MQRRNFLKKGLLSATAAGMMPSMIGCKTDEKTKPVNRRDNKLLNAYYFRAHMYTCVPSQIKEDMKWMAEHGTQVVSVGILEQDLWAAVENVEIIANEAAKLNMDIYAIPSRWGGLVAGAPKVPSLFSAKNPDTWMVGEDGKTIQSNVSGVLSSVYSDKTFDFVCESLEKAIGLWNIKGVIWDEPKTFHVVDHSKAALEKLGHHPSREENIRMNIDFYSRVNKHIKQLKPDVKTCMFLYANLEKDVIDKAATVENLDFYGCDGRPWHHEDKGKAESKGKTLLGNGERYLEAAHKAGKKSLWLVENHNMLDKDAELMDKRMPDVMSKPVDHLIYYYYPRNLQSPDIIMGIMGKHIEKF